VQRPGHPDEEPFRRLVLEHPGAAMAIAIDDEGQVLCLQQYRHPASRSFVEFPAGICDVGGEDPLEVARRELREEAALQARDWTHLLSTYSSPGISSEVIHLYLARDLSPADRGDFELVHEEAEMELFWAPFDELLDGVLDGRLADSPVALAVLTCRVRGLA
jgi:8-oxo-dGTP pyrophosphatase MutT (NUDIX family)